MDLYLNLKICESCGCLWLRTESEASVYCAPCYERLRQFPAVHGRKRRGRRPSQLVLNTVHAVDATQCDDDDLFEELDDLDISVLLPPTRFSATEGGRR